MFWCLPPPIDFPRRISFKRRYPDFAPFGSGRKVSLYRGPSTASERSLIETKFTPSDEVLLIDSPFPPPKDRKSFRLLPHLEFEPKSPDEPAPQPSDPKPPSDPHPPLKVAATTLPEEPEDEPPAHPWYRRRLVSSRREGAYGRPAVFPRSDFSLSAPGPAATGLNLFGGLGDRARNDFYSIAVADLSVSRLYTTGDVPSTRFGHGSTSAGSVVAIWGGDTVTASSHQLRTRVRYDNGLYFLNLATREWTRVFVDGPSPSGRIGHTVTMIGPRIYVFGGQAYGQYFNDIWCFDLATPWEQLDPPKGAPRPSPRSGHTCVAYKHHLIVFGGTDGKYHYNDIWAFDTRSCTWSEYWCSGYIPAPREGHGSAVVGDVVYIFGGRGVDGANIGQLAAFRIPNQRWYTFQNMGPEPAPRSGHGMVAVGSKIYVLGGVSEDDLDGTGANANVAHVLETKYSVG
ncbi:galactose oxidase [Trametes sanguinea]|nr:galactose oxidase [Trametes sanguinea]